MTPNTPPPPNPPPLSSPPPQRPKKRRWLLYGCGSILALFLLIVATVAITIWWIQRPIKPVVLSPKEKATVEAKLRRIEPPPAQPAPAQPRPAPGNIPIPNTTAPTAELPPILPPPGDTLPRPYEPGSKVLKLTQREVNGLLNENTDLGKSVRLEFDKDAINAYLAVPIPQDFPIGGGKMFRARGRFRVSIGNGGAPYAILEDVSIFGLSLPKAWLGGIKGENLLGDAIGERNGKPLLQGIKSLRVEPGALVLEVED